MFFGGSFRCSPISVDSCPPDVSACAGMVGSHGLSPKLPPLFRSEDHAKRALEFPFSGFGYKSAFCAKPRTISTSTKRARNSHRICTSIFIGLKADQNQHLRKISRWDGNALGSRASTRAIVFCGAGLSDLSRVVPSFEEVSRELRGPSVRRLWFSGRSTFCALRNKWVSGLQLSCGSVAPQGQQNEHLRKNSRGVGRRRNAAAFGSSGPGNILDGLALWNPSA
jgi:hypothetical protein